VHTLIDLWLADRPQHPAARFTLRAPVGPITYVETMTTLPRVPRRPVSIDPAA
jgi:hypothetical protein